MIRIYGEEKNEELERIAAAAFVLLQLDGEAAAELEFVDCEEMAALNRQFRGKNKPTDVLSFPMLTKVMPFKKENYPFDTIDTGEVMLGSIVICRLVAEKNAQEYGHSTDTEVKRLFAHGLLHLLGFDHGTDDEEAQMRQIEDNILSQNAT